MLTCPSHPHEMVQQNKSQSVSDTYYTVFVQSDAAATILCTAHFGVATIWGQLLFKAFISLESPAGINDGWIMYIRAIQWWLLELSVVRQPLSPAVSHGTGRTTQTGLALCQKLFAYGACVTYSSRGYYSRAVFIRSELLIVYLLFEGGIYLKEYSTFDTNLLAILSSSTGMGWDSNSMVCLTTQTTLHFFSLIFTTHQHFHMD